jgi:hypothetical protein
VQKHAVAYPNHLPSRQCRSQDQIGPSWDSDDQPRRRNGAQEFIVDDHGKTGRRIDLDDPTR